MSYITRAVPLYDIEVRGFTFEEIEFWASVYVEPYTNDAEFDHFKYMICRGRKLSKALANHIQDMYEDYITEQLVEHGAL